MLFLKYLDDLEHERAMEAELVGKSYDYIIDAPHRWSGWAAPKKAEGSFNHDTATDGSPSRFQIPAGCSNPGIGEPSIFSRD